MLFQGPLPASCVPVSDFFPFGTDTGDLRTERSDDGGSGKVNLTVMFPFFGKRHDKLYVSTLACGEVFILGGKPGIKFLQNLFAVKIFHVCTLLYFHMY